MRSLGIIWSPAYKFNNEILNYIKSKVNVLTSFTLNLNEDLANFTYSIYKCENMEDWKISNKIKHIKSTQESKVLILIMDIDTNETYFHPFKKKEVFTNIESLKENIRNNYKSKVVDYYFDIIFHLTDSQNEYEKTLEYIKNFIIKNKKNNQHLLNILENIDNDYDLELW